MTNYDTIRPTEMGACTNAPPQQKERRKPRLLVIGHARHGKDTVADMMKNLMGLDFTSSSVFVGEECVWPAWGKERYATFDEMFEDRVNFRSTWANLILAYNTPDLSRTATGMLKDNDMYVGMRNKAELTVCVENEVFDYIIWVDASARLPLEPKDSMQLVVEDADLLIDNNGPEVNMHIAIENLQKRLHEEGYDVSYEPVIRRIAAELDAAAEPSADYLTEDDPSFRAYKDDPGDLEVRCNGQCGCEDGSLCHEQVCGGDEPTRDWMDAPAGATQVLDHGFFKVLEVMGSDCSICDSARMSYGRGTKKVNDDQGLINYLVSHHHTSPLEMAEIRMHMRMPIFVMRQWVRHRTANLNEYSGRYSEMVPLFYVPEKEQICIQGTVNKQGSADPMNDLEATNVRNAIYRKSQEAFLVYQGFLKGGLSRETARMILPLNTYTEVVWKLDVSNLLKFLWLRDDPHTQWETQQYAKQVSNAVLMFFPKVFNAYRTARQSTTLTQDEIFALITGDLEALGKSARAKIVEMRNRTLLNKL